MSLGITASHRRRIKPGTQYNKYFPATVGTNPLLSKGADVYQTIGYVEQVVKQTLDHTAKIAPVLKGSTLHETCRNIFNFCYGNIQYKLDKAGEEQLRTPARAWKDRKTGIDCDCFSIFVSSILHNLGIKHAYRICEINDKGYFQHIYIVVPSDQSKEGISGNQYITIDPVLDKFNTEAPGITKTHDKMSIPVRVLNGVDDQFLGEIDNQTTLIGVYNAFRGKMKNQVRSVRHIVKNRPKSLGAAQDQTAFLGMLDFAETVIDSGSDQGLAELMGLGMALEREEAMSGLAGYDGLGKGKFLKKVASAVKSVKTEVKKAAQKTASKVSESAKKVANSKAVAKVKTVAKKAVQAVAKYNPVSTAARAGFLLAMSTNMFGIADQVRWGYATPEQLARYGISSDQAAKAKAALAKISKMFVNDLKGQPENLKKAILSGKQQINGFDGFGVAAAASTSAAMAFIIKAKDWIKGLKIIPNLKKASELIKSKSGILKLAKDKAMNLLDRKKPTTIENNTLVEKETVEETNNTPPPSDGGYTPPPEEIPFAPAPDPVVSDQPMQVSDEPAAPEEKKGLSTGAKIGIAGGLLLLGIVAVSGKKKKGLGDTDGLTGTKSSKKRKTKTRTFQTRKGNKVKIAFSGAKKKTASKKLTSIIVK